MENGRSTADRNTAMSRGFCDDICNDKNPKTQIREQFDLSKQKQQASGQLQPIIFQQPPKQQQQIEDLPHQVPQDYDSERIQIQKHPAHLLQGAQGYQNQYEKQNAWHNVDDAATKEQEIRTPQSLTSTLKLDRIVVIHQNGQIQGTEDKVDSKELLSVPFSVIDIGMHPDLKHMINWHDRSILESYRDPHKLSFKSWKLHPKGYYINYSKESAGNRSILTADYYYQGSYLSDPEIQKKFTIPHGFGVQITKKYIYKGEFVKGCAYGKGRCQQGDDKTGLVHQGDWRDGNIFKGKIQNATLSYLGEMQHGVPHGKGKLRLKDFQIAYEGRFNQGVIEDTNATYDCPNYVYVGQFVNGKKNGRGTLRQKQKNTKKSQGKHKYRPPKVYQGRWEDDYFMEQLQ